MSTTSATANCSYKFTYSTRQVAAIQVAILVLVSLLVAPFLVIAWHSDTMAGFSFATVFPITVAALLLRQIAHLLHPRRYRLVADDECVRLLDDESQKELLACDRNLTEKLHFDYDEDQAASRFQVVGQIGKTNFCTFVLFDLDELSQLQFWFELNWSEIEVCTTAAYRRPATTFCDDKEPSHAP